jgi:pyrroloquinoline quinone biosynthesis protein D
MSTADQQTPALRPMYRLQWEDAQGCYVLLYPEGMVKLSQSAGEILNRVDGRRTVSELVTDLQIAFPGADLEQDVRNFLTQAHNHGWLDL